MRSSSIAKWNLSASVLIRQPTSSSSRRRYRLRIRWPWLASPAPSCRGISATAQVACPIPSSSIRTDRSSIERWAASPRTNCVPCCRALDSLRPRTSGNFGVLDGFVSPADCFEAKVLKAPPTARQGSPRPVSCARQIPLSYGNLRAISLIWSSRRDCIPLYPSLTPLPQGAGPAWAQP
ncbi:hypothetical protein CBM2637_A200455 [Cupriavidus taiwanensis]|nr:hypothetical protein CBM2637_A200455 [Cupriavidus taiwanensis]